jgi:O-antigen biosynthesis protein
MSRLLARGKYLYDGEQKFYVRGVSYGPFPPNSRGERYPEPQRTAQDFALMRAMGVNTVRVYVPPPPWMFDEAVKAGLRLMVGIPWPFHMAFLDAPGMAAEIRDTIHKGVTEMRAHGDAILAFSLGNEVRSDIVRWHGPRKVSKFLAELYDIGKQAAPDALFTYSNYPSAEYLDLTFLDFVSFNVYLHREEDFRRYLTHLMGITGGRPLVLSETGMDTIRQGEEHQAALLSWQGRAAFEMGLSGFIVFAFTDEWHTGGAEITDWAFGLVRKDRTPKLAFEAMKQVYAAPLPPSLKRTPKVSIVVPAYNASATIDACLESLKHLNYPDYETIVVDDGSTDSTATFAEQAGARTLKLEHRGLAAARNAGAEAATGEIVAYIDADAYADRDWLYFLVETITRRGAAAAGGPNFAPEPQSATAAALAVAPGIPREVRAGDDRLSQVCGCNMAITKAALTKIGGFDEMFTTAGDDTDLSWRLTDAGELLAFAPGAVVIHKRRATLRGYLKQQRGYGTGEGLLHRKYPRRRASADGLYGGSSRLASIFSRGRVYYGAFGRGLFQTMYSANTPFRELPISTVLILGAVMALAGWFLGAWAISALFWIAILATVAWIATYAATAPLPQTYSGVTSRFVLFVASLAGPAERFFKRVTSSSKYFRLTPEEKSRQTFRFGNIVRIEPTTQGSAVDSTAVLRGLREGLIKRGLTVVESDGFQRYDLKVLPLDTEINAIREGEGKLRVLWRSRIPWRTWLVLIAAVLTASVIANRSEQGLIISAIVTVLIFGAGFILIAMRLQPVIFTVANDVAASLHARVVEERA